MSKAMFLSLIVLCALLVNGCSTPYCIKPTPPPPKAGIVQTCPHPHMVWVPGHWVWKGRCKGYVWIPGRCARRP